MSAAYAKGVALALPRAQISCDRYLVVAMANEAMDKVRQAKLRDKPQAVGKALGTSPSERKTIKGLMCADAQKPQRLVARAAQRDALAAALGAEECAACPTTVRTSSSRR